jgi:ubiquinone/menaquinone biosynthesis C-methylase UbiE
MSQPSSPLQPDNLYIIDAESGAEMARLIDQDRMITRAMGGLFSERDDLSMIFDVLDIGCGPGGWVLDTAHHYREMDVTGIDISESMIQYAQAYAQVRQLSNAHFRVMNALHALDFPDASFDMVNARAIVGFVTPENLPALLRECQRVLRPGGTLRLTEGEWGFTNKPAVETLCALLCQAYLKSGRNFSPTGKHLGMTPLLEHFLRKNGFQALGSKAHVLNYSNGTAQHRPMYEDWRLMLPLLEPFFISTKVAHQEEIEHLHEQALTEMLEEDFCGLWYFLTVWGEMPREDQPPEKI